MNLSATLTTFSALNTLNRVVHAQPDEEWTFKKTNMPAIRSGSSQESFRLGCYKITLWLTITGAGL